MGPGELRVDDAARVEGALAGVIGCAGLAAPAAVVALLLLLDDDDFPAVRTATLALAAGLAGLVAVLAATAWREQRRRTQQRAHTRAGVVWRAGAVLLAIPSTLGRLFIRFVEARLPARSGSSASLYDRLAVRRGWKRGKLY